MKIKSYPDGSVFTGKHLAVGITAGAIGAVILFTVKEKISDWNLKRWMRKNNWPEESINRI